jgi:hypothetical protein
MKLGIYDLDFMDLDIKERFSIYKEVGFTHVGFYLDDDYLKRKETYVELILKITKEDCREFFNVTTGSNTARINCIQLLTGWAKTIDGVKYYQDIRPLTKLHFPLESLIDITKSIKIVYHLYY